MSRDPILTARRFAIGRFHGNRVPMSFRVEGGLHFIRGNHAPYFSLTYTAHRAGFPNQCYSGGAGHDEILAYFPQFADLAALHLADIDGVPMHAEANGWYKLAGAIGGMGERHHAANSKGQRGGEYREPTPLECLQMFADHCRVDIETARAVAGWVQGSGATYGVKVAREKFGEWMQQQRPRWKVEADACIAKHGLRVYGDPWPVAA